MIVNDATARCVAKKVWLGKECEESESKNHIDHLVAHGRNVTIV